MLKSIARPPTVTGDFLRESIQSSGPPRMFCSQHQLKIQVHDPLGLGRVLLCRCTGGCRSSRQQQQFVPHLVSSALE